MGGGGGGGGVEETGNGSEVLPLQKGGGESLSNLEGEAQQVWGWFQHGCLKF